RTSSTVLPLRVASTSISCTRLPISSGMRNRSSHRMIFGVSLKTLPSWSLISSLTLAMLVGSSSPSAGSAGTGVGAPVGFATAGDPSSSSSSSAESSGSGSSAAGSMGSASGSADGSLMPAGSEAPGGSGAAESGEDLSQPG